MKGSVTLLLCLICMLSFTISCKKETVKTKEGLEGVWELRKIYGSWATQTYQAGSGNDIRFARTYYEIRENGQVVESGEFEILADPTVVEETYMNIEAGKFTQRIDFKNA